MKRRGLIISAVVLSVFLIQVASEAAQVNLLSDNFNDNSIDYGMWRKDCVDGCSIDEEDQILKFTVYPSGQGNHAYLLSEPESSVSNWTGINFSGKWMMPSTGGSTETAEYSIVVYNDDDISKYFRVNYKTYSTDEIHFQADGLNEYYNRAKPSDWVYFALQFTPTGWAYYEGATANTLALVKSYSSTDMAGASNFYIKMGGWDSSVVANQRVYFDDISFDAEVNEIPEPATMVLLGSLATGLFSVAGIRKKK